MDTIVIKDLEVHFRVGVPDEERAAPQCLLVTLEMDGDFDVSADDLRGTIDYQAVAGRIEQLGRIKSWRLIETLANEVAETVLREFGARRVTVEVKKFVLPRTAYVAVRLTRSARWLKGRRRARSAGQT